MFIKIFSFLFIAINLFSLDFKHFINKTNCDQIIDKQVYTICYDYKMKGALYVAYTVNGKLSATKDIKKRKNFYTEKNLPKKYRSSNKDYLKSGYDKGHLASDGTFDYDEKVLRKTYTLANAVPQAPNINRYHYIKSERFERKIALKLGTVDVINAVVYSSDPKRIGNNKIAVPDSFWKMIYNKQKNFMKCFSYENDLSLPSKGDKLKDHIIDCDILIK